MIDAVLMFGLITALFEMVIVGSLKPRTRLRLLGSDVGCKCLHLAFLSANLLIHWGTLIGSMSAVLAFVSSVLTVAFMRRLWGYIKNDRHYTIGWIRYTKMELQ